MEKEKLIKHFELNGKTDTWLNLAIKFDILPNSTNKQRSDKVRKIFNNLSRYEKISKFPVDNEYSEFIKWKKSQIQPTSLKPYLYGNPDNVLIIPDIHIPFEHQNALNFVREQQEKFDCGKVIFIGDIIDGHAWSFHDRHHDAKSIREEYELALTKIQEWYKVFPEAIVTTGNHDDRIGRKVDVSGLSRRFMKPLNEIFNVPNWQFVDEIYYNGVLYTHGTGGSADQKLRNEFTSVVQGHYHSEGYIKYFSGNNSQLFAMQVGTMIDRNSYAFEYASRGKKPILSCGVVLNKLPILIPFQ